MKNEGCLPLSVGAGRLKGGEISLAATTSSQYVSALLLSAPYAAEPVTLRLVGGAVVSQPYIDMTLAMMRGAKEQFLLVFDALFDAVSFF